MTLKKEWSNKPDGTWCLPADKLMDLTELMTHGPEDASIPRPYELPPAGGSKPG